MFCFSIDYYDEKLFWWWLISSSFGINCSFLLNGLTSLNQAFRSENKIIITSFFFFFLLLLLLVSQGLIDFLRFFNSFYLFPWADHSCNSSWTWSSSTWIMQDCKYISIIFFSPSFFHSFVVFSYFEIRLLCTSTLNPISHESRLLVHPFISLYVIFKLTFTISTLYENGFAEVGMSRPSRSQSINDGWIHMKVLNMN